MKAARILIADDHQVVRRGLRNAIESTGEFQVVAEAADAPEAERLARELPADLLILDIALPNYSGLRVLESLRSRGSALPILFFTIHPADQYAAYVRNKGAQGFVGKDAATDEVLRAVRRILAGGTCFPNLQRNTPSATHPFSRLSNRELDVLRGLVSGEALGDIAARIGVGAKSVSTYRRRILDKTGVKSNAELISLAITLNYR